MNLNLVKSLLIITLTAFIFGGISQTVLAKGKKKIGLQLYSVRDDLKKDTKGTIEALGKIGYSYLEAANYNNGKLYGMTPEDFKALLDKNGMKLLSSHTGIDYTGDQASWDAAMIWWDQCIDAHKKAGCKYIIKPGMGKYAYGSLEGLKKTCEYFNAVGEKCNKAGIRFGYHNHTNEFKNIPGTDLIIYDYMLKNTDPAKVTFEMDTYWIYKGGKYSVDYFNKYPGRFELLHIKDAKELGASGEMNFKPIFDNMKLAGTKAYFVENEEYNCPPLESVQKCIEFLNKADYVK
jgi:sugar phosphate isomerase/epimerase